MDQIFQGLQYVVCFMDDILVSAPSAGEHLVVLDKVLSRPQQHGVRVKKTKGAFLCNAVEYLGFKMDENVRASDGEQGRSNCEGPCLNKHLRIVIFSGTFELLWKVCGKSFHIVAPTSQIVANQCKLGLVLTV
ncbi:hypothetical protein QTP86_026429 [Hemibagrus guttatus]|nr:hypothetical protein QTP86_026429 [Hemibagrus guttatus]